MWKKKQKDQIAILNELNLKKSQSFLDLGCGTGRIGIFLTDFLAGRNYTGIDSDVESINLFIQQVSINQLSYKSPNIFACQDFGKSKLLNQTFDFIWAFNVFIHMHEEILINAFTQVGTLLEPNGKCYFTIRLSDSLEDSNIYKVTGRWLEFPICCASFSYFSRVADNLGMKFSFIRPISNLKKRLI